MEYKIALIRGDGIGPEIVEQAVGVMNAWAKSSTYDFLYRSGSGWLRHGQIWCILSRGDR